MKILERIGFIGAGNMAEALIKGLLAHGVVATNILVADPSDARRTLMQQSYQVRVAADNRSLVEQADILVLAIKPQMVETVLADLADVVTERHLLVSILAGTATATLEGLVQDKARVIRVMPNTPALVGLGASALCAGKTATDEDLSLVTRMFAAVGSVQVVREVEMDAVTGLSGSGPAYIYTVIEALAEGGVRQGLSEEVALSLAVQTVAGAARMVVESGELPGVLRQKVCSPGGTTLAGLTALDDGDLSGTLIEAVARATKRSIELGQG